MRFEHFTSSQLKLFTSHTQDETLEAATQNPLDVLIFALNLSQQSSKILYLSDTEFAHYTGHTIQGPPELKKNKNAWR